MKLGTSDSVVNLQDALAAKGKKTKGNNHSAMAKDGGNAAASLFGGKLGASAFAVAKTKTDDVLVADGVASLKLGDNDNGLSDHEFFGSLLQQMELKWKSEYTENSETDENSAEPPADEAENADQRLLVKEDGLVASLLSAGAFALDAREAGPQGLFVPATPPDSVTKIDEEGQLLQRVQAGAVGPNNGYLSVSKMETELPRQVLRGRDGIEMDATFHEFKVEATSVPPGGPSVAELLQPLVPEQQHVVAVKPLGREAEKVDSEVDAEASASGKFDKLNAAPSLSGPVALVAQDQSGGQGDREHGHKHSDHKESDVPAFTSADRVEVAGVSQNNTLRSEASPASQGPTPYQQIAANIHRAAASSAVGQSASGNAEEIKTLKITLHPDTLGDVEVVIRRRGETLDVKLKPGKESTAELLAKDSSELMRSLDLLRLDAAEVVVSVDTSSFREPNRGDSRQESSREFQQTASDSSRQQSRSGNQPGSGQSAFGEQSHADALRRSARTTAPSSDTGRSRAGGVYL